MTQAQIDGNGNGNGSRPPVGQKFDMLWGQDGQHGDPSKLLLEFPTHIGDWLSRGIIDVEDLQFMVNEEALLNSVYRGQTDMQQIMWLYIGGTTMVNGKAREQFVDVQKHLHAEQAAARRGVLGHIGGAREGPAT